MRVLRHYEVNIDYLCQAGLSCTGSSSIEILSVEPHYRFYQNDSESPGQQGVVAALSLQVYSALLCWRRMPSASRADPSS